MRFSLIILVLIALFAIPRVCLPQCSNVNQLSKEAWEELLDSGNVPEGDWPQLIDCVYDWIDADIEHRLNGAESGDPFYTSQGYMVSNAPLAKVTDLLLVKGFNHAILYGGTNQSGVMMTGIVYQLTTWSTNGNCDFDYDNMPDWYEDGYGFLNPTNATDGVNDEDSDLLSNAGEYEQDTDPNNPDSDSDRVLDGNEVLAGTNPTDPSSFLGMELPSPAPTPMAGDGLIVQWQSVTGREYRVYKASNLISIVPFSVLATGILGQADTTQITDTTAVATGPYFYRVETDGK